MLELQEHASFPLSLKLALAGIVLAVLPLLGVGLALIDINVRAVKDQVRELQVAVADDVARGLNDMLLNADTGLVVLRRALVEDALSDDTRLQLAAALLESNSTLDHVSLHDASGALIDTIRQSPEVHVPPLVFDPATDHSGARIEHEAPARVVLIKPIEVRGVRTGFISSQVALTEIRQRIDRLAGAHFPDQPKPLRLADATGRVFAGDAKFAPLPSPVTRTLQAALQGVAPSIEFDINGTAMTAATIAVPHRAWYVIIQQPQDVVYGSLIEMRRIVVFTIAAAIGLALLFALLFARRITRPMRLLTQLAGQLSARQFGEVVEINTQDELSVLGRALSDASVHLQASEDRLVEEVAIRTDLGRYLPREIVDKIVSREQNMALGGQRTAITVLFADVVGFTPLTEQQSPEVVVTLLNELFTILTDIVFRHGGTIDKFIGDCVMAVWGAPNPHPDHAKRALAAAEDMLRWVEVGAAGWAQRYGVDLKLAIGLNTGEAVVGNIGSDTRMEYTAIGDTVNIAARLESIARPMQILLTEDTRQAAGPDFDYTAIGERALSGRREPVMLYEVQF